MYRNATFLRFVKFITLVFEVPLFDHKYLQYSLLKRDDVSCQQHADVITSHLNFIAVGIQTADAGSTVQRMIWLHP